MTINPSSLWHFKTSGKIIELILANPNITIAELAEKIDITERYIERNLQQLQKDKKIIRIGPPEGGRWEVIQ